MGFLLIRRFRCVKLSDKMYVCLEVNSVNEPVGERVHVRYGIFSSIVIRDGPELTEHGWYIFVMQPLSY